MARYGIFILEARKAWVEEGWETIRTLHHRGCGRFALDGEFIVLPSKMR